MDLGLKIRLVKIYPTQKTLSFFIAPSMVLNKLEIQSTKLCSFFSFSINLCHVEGKKFLGWLKYVGWNKYFVLKYSSRDEIVFFYIRRDHQFQWYPSTYLLHCLRKLLNHLQEEQDKFNLKKNCLFVKCYIFTLREFSRWSSINLSGKKRWKSYFIINFIVISEFTHYLSLEKQRYNVCAEEWFFFEN